MLNPVALRTAKTLRSFGCSECNRVKGKNWFLGKHFIFLASKREAKETGSLRVVSCESVYIHFNIPFESVMCFFCL